MESMPYGLDIGGENEPLPAAVLTHFCRNHPQERLLRLLTPEKGGITMLFEHLARKHWTKYLPEKTAALKEAGLFETAIKEAADQAKEEAMSLVNQGMKPDSAKEIVIKNYILLPPETTI